MADNVRITQDANSTPPDGTFIATDDVGGIQYQIMKLATGGDGVANLVDGDNGINIVLDLSSLVQLQQINTHLHEIIAQLKVNNFLLNVINDSNVTTSDIE